MIYIISAWIFLGITGAVVINSFWAGRFPSQECDQDYIVGYILALGGAGTLLSVLLFLFGRKLNGVPRVFYPLRFWPKL